MAAGLQGRRYKKALQTRRTSLDRPPSPTPPPATLLSAPSAPPAAPSPGDPAAARAGFPTGAPPAQVQDKPDTRSALGPGSTGCPSPFFTSHKNLWDPELKASAFEATRLADVYLRAPEPRLYLNLYGCSLPTPANPALVLACCHRGLASDSKFFLSIWQMRSLRYLRLHQIIFQAGCVCVQTWPVSAKCDPLTPSIITARKRKTSSSSINCSMRLISGPQHHRLTATCHQKVKPAGPDPEDR